MARLGIQSRWPGKTTHGVKEGERTEKEYWRMYQVLTVLMESAGNCVVYITIIIVPQEEQSIKTGKKCSYS